MGMVAIFEGNHPMRYAMKYDREHDLWLVIDKLSANQMIGRHTEVGQAQAQIQYEEHLWQRFSSNIRYQHLPDF